MKTERADRTAVLEGERRWFPARNWEAFDDPHTSTDRTRRYLIPETDVNVMLVRTPADAESDYVH